MVPTLVDTGASRSLLSGALYSKLVNVSELEPAPRMVGIGGHVLNTRGECFVNIGKGVKLRVVVVDDIATDLLLGADALLQAGSCIDFTAKQLTIMGRKYPFKLRHTTPDAILSAIELPPVTYDVLAKVITNNRDIFGSKDTLGECTLPAVTIDTGSAAPIKQRAYRMPFAKREVIETEVKKMLELGVIEPSASPWASPVTLVPKKDGTTRFCVDYRKVNSVTTKDAHPLPHIQDVFDALGGAKIYSTLDLRSGYWQIPMSRKDRSKTAFTCHLGLFEFTRLPFGLTNAPAQFQRIMNFVLSDLIGHSVLVYIDDIIVYSQNEEEHAKHLEMVFKRLRQYNLTLKASKCNIGKHEVELLGYVISSDGIRPQKSKTEAISGLACPSTVREVRSFLGMAGYYRQCIEQFAEIAEPLTRLTRKNEPFVWTDEQTNAFNKLKAALISEPILAYPDTSKPYILHTDASDKAIGAILTQDQNGQERVIAYLSHQLSSTQRRWAAIEREAYAVVYALDHLKCYLWGADFQIFTDHKPLTSLFRAEIRNTKIQRWAIQISEFGAPILYRKGKHNIRADMLSRIASVQIKQEPIERVEPPVEEDPLPWHRDGLDPETMGQLQKTAYPDTWSQAGENGHVINNGILYSTIKPTENSEQRLRLVLPPEYHHQVTERCHHDTGHQAMLKTLDQVRRAYVWPGMRKFVTEFVATCPLCQVYKDAKPEKEVGRMPVPPRPLHTWGIDLIGPFVPSLKHKNKYIMTCIDHLTGWVEGIPIANKTNECVWQALMENIVARYGLPEVIVTDNGGEFTAKNFESFLAECGVRKVKVTPYHPETNGRIERFNGTLKRILKKLVANDEVMWEQRLPEALWAYRQTEHVSVGRSPYQALFGMAPRQPGQSIPGVPPSQHYKRLTSARKLARACQEKKAQETFEKRQLRHSQPPMLHPGDMVLKKVNVTSGLSSKWDPGWTVIEIRGPVVTISRDSETKVVNREKLRLSPPDLVPEVVNPRQSRIAKKKVVEPKWRSVRKPGNKLVLKRVAAVAGKLNFAEWDHWLKFVSASCCGTVMECRDLG